MRTPYGRRQWAGMIGRLFAERGYQVVIQSCRGTFGSGGTWVPFRHNGPTVGPLWNGLLDQPWFPGALATFGPSYLGLTQWAVATEAPSSVRAMALSVTASDFRQAVVYPSECFALGTSLAWLQLLEYQEHGWLWALLSQRRNQKALASGVDVLPLAVADRPWSVGEWPIFRTGWSTNNRVTPGGNRWISVDISKRYPRPPWSAAGTTFFCRHRSAITRRCGRPTERSGSPLDPGLIRAPVHRHHHPRRAEWFAGHLKAEATAPALPSSASTHGCPPVGRVPGMRTTFGSAALVPRGQGRLVPDTGGSLFPRSVSL